jgi:D-alanyl-D-alanine carboxypeptidase
LIIEICQYVFALGSADIDDLILNTIGGVSGYIAYVFIIWFIRHKKAALVLCALMIMLACAGFFAYDNLKHHYYLTAPGNHIAHAEAVETNRAGEAGWNLILVNKWNYIPFGYKAELKEFENGQSVDRRIYRALGRMFEDAGSDGVYPIVVSGHRTAEKQQRLLDDKIAEYIRNGNSPDAAVMKAEEWVAVPGTSEHQLGIAVDINNDAARSTWEEVYGWLAKNAHKYGFILRYPPDKTEITGVINEPWHYRYVGKEAAAEIYEQGICLEEYLSGR